MAVDRRGHSAGDVGAHRGSWGLHRERRWSPRVCGDIFTLRLAHAPAMDKVTLRNIDERILVEDDTGRGERTPTSLPTSACFTLWASSKVHIWSVALEFLERGRGVGCPSSTPGTNERPKDKKQNPIKKKKQTSTIKKKLFAFTLHFYKSQQSDESETHSLLSSAGLNVPLVMA